MSKITSFVAVYGILRNNNGEILYMRRANSGYMDGFYSLPAGHVENGENPKIALVREVMEETGVSTTVDDLEFSKIIYNPATKTSKHPYVYMFFEVKNWDGEPKIMEVDKCDDMRFLEKTPEKTVPELHAYFEDGGNYGEL